MTWKLALRHLSRHWRLNLALWTVMLMGAALLASLPMLAAAIAEENLSQSLQSGVIQNRNLIIQGKSKTDDLPENVILSLGDLLKESIAVREADIAGFSTLSKADGNQVNLYPATVVLNLWSFDRLEARVRILEGRLPETGAGPGMAEAAPIYETAIGIEAARRLDLGLGDQLSPLGDSYMLQIVGVVEPINPNAEVWWGDRQMLPFSTWRRIYTSPDIDEWNISLLLPSETMLSRIQHQQYWRVILDHQQISASNAPAVRETLIELQSSLSDDEMVLSSGLMDWITQFEGALSLARVSLLLLSCQSLLAVFYLLVMFGGFLVEQSQAELDTLSGRGFSRLQITALFARSSILLAALAVFAAPWLARWSLYLWADWKAIPAPGFIPVESWWLALSSGLVSWITLVVSVYRATRQDLRSGQGQGLRLDTHVQTQRHPIWDFFILTLGGVAYWQLVQGSTITPGMNDLSGSVASGTSDLVLLLGPTLLLLAASLILIRLLPLIWRLLAWISRKSPGLLWSLRFARLARQPVGPSQVTLLISLTAGLALFASAFSYSLNAWQQNMARYLVGADIRISQSLIKMDEGIIPIQSPEITNITQVLRAKVTLMVDEIQRVDFDLLAVDPLSFPEVIAFPPGVSPYSIDQILSVLEPGSSNLLPVVISSNAHTRHLDIGDPLTLELGGESYPSEVVGIIVNFPLVDNFFAITDLSQLSQRVALESLALTDQGSGEIWIAADAGEQDKVLSYLDSVGLGDSIVGNSQAQLEIFQNNLVFRQVSLAFELNAFVLIPLSVVGFALIQLFSAQRRGMEFNILLAMGLSKAQLRSLLLLDGLFFVFLGLLIGTGVGFGLTTLMRPFLSQILPSIGHGFVFNQIQIAWSTVGYRFLVLLGTYAIGLVVLMIRAMRSLKPVQS